MRLLTILLANFIAAHAASGQYLIETYAGRPGPKTGTPVHTAYIDSWGLAIGPNGNLLYYSPYQLIEIDTVNGVIGRVLGPADLRFDLASPGGDRDYYIDAITTDVNGNIYLLDDGNSRILKIAPDGTMAARLIPTSVYTKFPGQIAATSDGGVYWTGSNQEVQKLDFDSGTTSVVAGNLSFAAPAPDGSLATSVACNPPAVAVDRRNDTMYFLDWALIRKIDSEGRLVTVADLSGQVGAYELSPNMVAAPDGMLLLPGNLGLNRIDPESGTVTPIAGGKQLYTEDLWIPTRRGVVEDTNGTVYVTNPARIDTIDDATGTITPLAGNGQSAFTTSKAPAADLQFTSDSWLGKMAAGPDGTLFMVEPSLYQIRMIDAVTRMTWAVPIFPPWNVSIAVDRDGLLYAGTGCQVQKLDPQTGKTQVFLGSFDCSTFPNGSIEALAFDVSRSSLYVMAGSVWKIDIDSGSIVKIVDQASLTPIFPLFDGQLGGYGGVAQMAADAGSNLYVHRGGYGGVAKVTPDGITALFLGDLSFSDGSTTIDWTANSLEVQDMAVSADGAALFILQGNSVQRVDLATHQMMPIAGSARLDLPVDGGDGGPALDARFSAGSFAVAGDSIFLGSQFLIRRIYPGF